MWKRPNLARQHQSVGKIMLVMFWDQDGVLLTDYLVGGQTINGIYHASLIERLHDVISEKRRGKINNGVLLLHDNALVHKSHIVQAAIRQTGLVELNHPAYSPDIAPSDYHMFFHMKKFLRGKSFSSNDEVIRTVEDYIRDLDSKFFSNGISALHDRWQRVVASDGYYI